ncbi:MAG: glycosyltransferase family protein [Firmicutes bacterium]|nr:glycosyltransferase family protein [Bacillota bacterium]
MDPHTVSFITCVNDERQYAGLCRSIRALAVPRGWELELIPVRGARSLAGGYNAGLRQARGRYKVYLHQDVRLAYRPLLRDLLRLFRAQPALGLVGVIGAVGLPASGVWWEARQLVGTVWARPGPWVLLAPAPARAPFTPVEAVDGLFMATQYDLPWREDLFDGWHFYDASQCQEFRRAGYQVGVPPQAEPWCLHDSGPTDLTGFEPYRHRFVAEYHPGPDPGPAPPPGGLLIPSGHWQRAPAPAGAWTVRRLPVR